MAESDDEDWEPFFVNDSPVSVPVASTGQALVSTIPVHQDIGTDGAMALVDRVRPVKKACMAVDKHSQRETALGKDEPIVSRNITGVPGRWTMRRSNFFTGKLEMKWNCAQKSIESFWIAG